ncbi:hypothetical protein JCM5296_003706 [Sporobolomyces johnsonii]
MPRFILFDGAPTLAECLASENQPNRPPRCWQTFELALPAAPPTRSTGPPPPTPPPEASQFQDAETQPKNMLGEEEEVPAWADRTSSQFADADTSGEGERPEGRKELVPDSQDEEEVFNGQVEERSGKRARISLPEDEPDEEASSSRFTFMLPPPTQSQRRRSSRFPAASQPISYPFPPTAPDTTNQSTTFIEEDSYASTFGGGLSIGAPPRFPWKISSIVKLDKLRSRLRPPSNNRDRDPEVSVLGAVSDVSRKDTSVGPVTEITIEDETGGLAKAVIWGDAGDELGTAIRRGDVVYFGHVKLKHRDNQAIELRFDPRSSEVGICWRTRRFTAEDDCYHFHEGFREVLPEADAVAPLLPRRPIVPLLAMPPRKAAASTASAPKKTVKRRSSAAPKDDDSPAEDKAAVSADESEEEKPKKKKAKKEPVQPLDDSLPTNTTLPDPLEPFPRPGEGQIRIAAWNVSGLRASEKKGFSKYIEAEDADVVVITETKCEEIELPVLDDRYPHRYWGVNGQKGQAGTAVFSKIAPVSVVLGMPTTEPEVPQKESEGRIVTLEFPNTYLVGTYVPNAGQGLKNLDLKAAWNKAFERYVRDLDAKKPVIWCGDLNVIPTEKDIRNWKTNYNKSPGCTDTEIDGFAAQLNPPEDSGHKKLVDVWRHQNPDDEAKGYTYYSYKFQCRSKGIGWRLDFFVASERLLGKVKQCEVRHSIWGASDHLPLILDIEGPL